MDDVRTVGNEQQQFVRFGGQPLEHGGNFLFGHELRNRGTQGTALSYRDPRQPFRPPLDRLFRQLVDLTARPACCSLRVDGLHKPVLGRIGKYLEPAAAHDVRNVNEFETEPQVRLVRSVPFDCLLVRNAPDRQIYSDSAYRKDALDEAFHHAHDVITADERHFDVDLGKLGLPVGAQVLVAEAADDLIIPL